MAAINTNKILSVGSTFCIMLMLQITASAQSFPQFRSLRYQEDYYFLKDDSSLSVYESAKYIPLSRNSNAYLSFGGAVRYQYFNIRNEDWGASAKDNNGFVLSRFLVHTDLHISYNVRTFVQLQSGFANNKASGTSAVDENPLDLHQVFVDVQTRSQNLVLRAGRQELSYGSQRLVAVRELPNNRQAFDAVKFIWKQNGLQADLFYSRYVVAKKNIFDDASGRDIKLWGAYVVRNLPFSNIDVYYLGLEKKNAFFNDGTRNELRHSVGVRIWNEQNNWRYDVEAVHQFGRFSEKQIKAWTISCNTGYRFTSIMLQPELGLKTEIISGDRKKGDAYLHTFNPLFPKGAYFGLAALIGPSNLFDVHPSLEFLLKEKLVWSIDYDAFWRSRTSDGIYAPNVALLYPSGDNDHKFIGHQFATDISYSPNAFLLFRIESTWFRPGDYLKAVSPGKDMVLFCLTGQLTL